MFSAQARTTRGCTHWTCGSSASARAKPAQKNTAGMFRGRSQRISRGALSTGKTAVTDDANALIDSDIEVLVDITGATPAAATRHILRAFEHGKHVAITSRSRPTCWSARYSPKARARKAGLVYALAYGDQRRWCARWWIGPRPAAFSCPSSRQQRTPNSARLSPVDAGDSMDPFRHHAGARESGGRVNPQMFNSFVDSTGNPRSEMAPISNAHRLSDAPRDARISTLREAASRSCRSVLQPARRGSVLEKIGLVDSRVQHGTRSRPSHTTFALGRSMKCSRRAPTTRARPIRADAFATIA